MKKRLTIYMKKAKYTSTNLQKSLRSLLALMVIKSDIGCNVGWQIRRYDLSGSVRNYSQLLYCIMPHVDVL